MSNQSVVNARNPPVAVTFDFWDTLLRAPRALDVRAARRERLLAALHATGIPADEAAFDAAMAGVRREFDRRWAENRQFHAPEAAELLVASLAGSFGEPSGPLDGLADAIRGRDDDHVPDLLPNVRPTLVALKDAGVRIGIVCDVGLSPSTMLRGYLEHHGVLGCFDHWSFSDEVGIYKPAPEIFRHALDGLGVDVPANAAHVGDLRRTDVAGARAFGMISVRYAGSNDDVPAEGDRSMLGASGITDADRTEADHVITDHADLPAALGLI